MEFFVSAVLADRTALVLTSRTRAVFTACAISLALPIPGTSAQDLTRAASRPAAPHTILAIGAHAGDIELTAGQVLLASHDKGDRVVILEMTLGEGGNPKL